MTFRILSKDEVIPKPKVGRRPRPESENAKIARMLRAGERVEVTRTKPKGKNKNLQGINLRSAMAYRGIRVSTTTTEKHIYLTMTGEIQKPDSDYILRSKGCDL